MMLRLRLWAAAAAAAVVVMAGGAAAQEECPCGFGGEDCAEALVDYAPNGTCAQGACQLYPSYATCRCELNWGGRLCDEENPVIVWSMVVGGWLIPLAVLGGGVFLLVRRRRKLGSAEWDFDPRMLTEGRVGAKGVLAYRSAILLFALVVQGIQYSDNLGGRGQLATMYRFYTVTTWTLLEIYFILAVYLSVRAVAWPETEARAPTRLECFVYVLLETVWPTCTLIAIVVWGVLYPANPNSVLGFTSYIQHGANIVMIGLEFVLLRAPMQYNHTVYPVLYGTAYLLYHSLLLTIQYASGLQPTPSYAFLTTTSPLLAAWVLGLLVVIIVVYKASAWVVNRFNKGPWEPAAGADADADADADAVKADIQA